MYRTRVRCPAMPKFLSSQVNRMTSRRRSSGVSRDSWGRNQRSLWGKEMSAAENISPAPEISLAVAVAEPGLRQQALDALRALPVKIITDDCGATLESVLASAERLGPDILMLGLPGFSNKYQDTLAALAALPFPPRVIVLNDSPDSTIILGDAGRCRGVCVSAIGAGICGVNPARDGGVPADSGAGSRHGHADRICVRQRWLRGH